MLKRFFTIAMAAVLTTAALAQSQTAKPEAAKPAAARSKVMTMLQGTWVMASMNGQDLAGAPEIVVTITDNNYTQSEGGNVSERGSFKLDETKKPMTLDLMVSEGESAGKTQMGVIEVTDTTMRGKLNTPGDTVRPTDFAPSDGFFAFTATKRK